MAYKGKVAIDANGIKEECSVLFILNLLHGRTCNRIDLGTTQSNIDGYIELLDSSNRTNGKITVQVKTVNKRDEGFNRYPCPTSLFAYADVTTDNVFLLAVDHSCNKVLWKHISRELLEANRNKENQDTITLYFDSNEELRVDNISKTLNTWLKICKSYIELICHGENIIAVLVDYSDPRNKFIFHVLFFRNLIPSNEKILIIEDIANSKIMNENNLNSPSNLYTKDSVLFNGKQFSCFRGGGLSDMTILFDKYNCLTYFYELLRTHFEDYFKKKGL